MPSTEQWQPLCHRQLPGPGVGQAGCRWRGKGLSLSSSLQVLGREGPFPLILLPQFGGYWIEGTNHDLTGILEGGQLQSPTAKVKLECNHTARLYRKHFLGKVREALGVARLSGPAQERL